LVGQAIAIEESQRNIAEDERPCDAHAKNGLDLVAWPAARLPI
jgi:hypothetical protein